MNEVRFYGLDSNNQVAQAQNLEDQAVTENKINEPPSKILTWFSKYWWILAIIASIIVAVVVLLVCVVLKKGDDSETTEDKPEKIFPPELDQEKTKEVFSPLFSIQTKEKTLTQLSQKSSQTYISSNSGQSTSYSFLNEALYDIYTINSTNSSNSEDILYTTKYTTVITVKSFCSKVSSNPEEDSCQLQRQLDLNIKGESNLRRNEEEAEDLIKKAILPICIVEHTDRNLIISLTCPETLDPGYKADIIRAFGNIKPDTMKGFEIDKAYVDTITEEKDNKVYITSFDNLCTDQNYENTKICNISKNIITDKEGNLIYSKISNATKTNYDENNSFSNNFTYEFKNVPKENSESFDEETFKKNLDTILSLINPIMKKEIFIGNMIDFAVEIMKDEEEPEQTTNLRDLMEQESKKPGVQEENIFTKTICNISMDLNLKNDVGLTEDKTTEASSIHDVNKENYTELSNNKIQTYLYDTVNKFISLSKSGNKMAEKFYEDLNEPLVNFMDVIYQNIQIINNFLANKDLSEIFDSTLAINELNTLPFDFVTATNNLFVTIKDLQDNLLYTINDPRKKLEENVSKFLTDSHNLLFKIFNNLTELSEALSTDNSKIVGIAAYYLNNTDVSYYEIIQSAKNILDNYYKNEKKLISPLIEKILEKFYNNAKNSIEKYQSMLDNISDRLNDGNLLINLANTEQYQTAISNIYNTKIKVNEIIETIKTKFQESIKLQSNGYFETQHEIEQNSQSYGEKSEKALKISYALDNNEFIDKTFDNIMTSFRDKFVELLKYMENSLKEKFPLEQNVLGTSLFGTSFLNEIDDFLQTQKINVLNFIKNENDEYLKLVNEHLGKFTSEDGKNLDQLMSDLLNALTDLYLDNLNTAYGDSLSLTFKTIDEIIENNKNLGNEYLTSVKNANSFHITTGFKNKYNTYTNSIQAISDFINKNLKINLSNKYKNVITQIRALLQSIKSNNILEKYYKQLPSAEKHLNSIKDLFEIFNRHISDKTYNLKFLPLINNYIESAVENLNKIKQSFKVIYDEVAKKDSNNIQNDYDSKRVESGGYTCRRYRWRFWKKKCTKNPDKIYYDGKNVKGTNNHLNLKQINFEEYIKNFDNKYNELYPQFSENVNKYNSLLSNLDVLIENEATKETFNEKNNYLENISNKIKSIIEEKLGNNLLIASYNYYKNKIINILPTELNDITEEWKGAYDQVYNDINSNKDNFKSSVFEIYYISLFYIQAYTQNISYGYGKSIVEKLKNDFNYTNKYYYNLITSKLNKTYAYILNNLPTNEKPFDKILNRRIEEIKNSYNNILNELKTSKDIILDKNKQEMILQVNSKNFFYINDVISSHIKSFNNTLYDKANNILLVSAEILKENPAELIAAKFYLENSINGKQIKDNYDMVNKATFIDLQTDVYQQLIDDIWKIDRDELIKNILNALIELNEINNNNFKYENQKYIEILQNKLYEEFETKENLIQKINSFFSKGINKFNENSKTQIDEILTSILNKIIAHITNEASRLINELTSYSNDFTDIKIRLNNYKTSIYEQFYSTITYVVNDFHEQILEKYYKNYIEKGLNEYEKYIQETDFGNANFLNMSINLNSVIDKEFQLLINDYRNLTLNQIQFLYQKNIQTLDQIFSFSNIKLSINNEIDNIYNSKLLPELQKVGTHNPGDEGVSNYDLPEAILNDINAFIKEKIENLKNIMKDMEGKEYTIENMIPADFSPSAEDNIYAKISKMFQNFTLTYTSQEKNDFDKVVGENALNNFKTLMQNFIPSFGVDFFDRILKYNEIQKINTLYDNLRYSLAETILYYMGVVSINENAHLPVDIKLRLFNLNDLDSVVKTKNDLIISTLNEKLDSYFDETKNYITTKYINDINTNEEFDLKFKADLKETIKGLINGNVHNYENEYINMMKENIKTHFIEEYRSVLNSATKFMNEFIENTKIELKGELDKTFSLDSDSILADSQTKLNKTKTAVDDYNTHFATFQIPEAVINFLENFGSDVLAPKYRQLKDLLDKKTTELVINNLETLSNAFREEYSIENFQEEVKKINKNFTSYFNKFNNIITRYGYIEDVYKQNLDKEIANYRRIRLLEEADSQKTSDVKLNTTFNELKKSSKLTKDFIQSLSLFSDFEDNLKKYINEKNNQYSFTTYNLEKNKNQNDNYDLMIERLEELNKLSSEYYPKAKNIYEVMKEQIIDNIVKINELINSCEKVTYETINNRYIEIKEKCEKIDDSKNLEKKEISIIPYKTNITDNYFTVLTNVENYLIDNKFTLDVVFEEETKTPKIIGKLINNISPKKFNIDFYSSIGQNGKLGRTINVAFNNIESSSEIVFDSGSNKATIVTKFNFDEYTVKTQYYEETTKTIIKNIMGMTIVIPGVVSRVDIDTPDNEKINEVPSKSITLTENYLY